jgi:hypothetical protein
VTATTSTRQTPSTRVPPDAPPVVIQPAPAGSYAGYAAPLTPVYGPVLEGGTLYDFIQAWVAGVSGLPGDLVRVAYAAEPPNPPSAGTCWAAITVQPREAPPFAQVTRTGVDQATLYRHETLELLCSFFDLGATPSDGFGGEADAYASVMRDGILVEQNRWVLQNNGWGVLTYGELTPVPVLLKERWNYRVDLKIRMVREIRRAYAVPDLAVATVGIAGQEAGVATPPLTVDAPPAVTYPKGC